MLHETGELSIHAENLLPIIKKWLYSEKDIFVREMVSNACDAVAKHRVAEGGEQQYAIHISINKDEKTLTFADNGIGMTEDEVRRYINQVAFSGAQEFLDKYKDQAGDKQIIGHFGLGFYSAFMVSERVRIDTKSYVEDADAVRWESAGGTTYEMGESDRAERGTTITLFLNEEGEEYLDMTKLQNVLNTYCSFMPVEIYVNGGGKPADGDEKPADGGEKPVNNPNPLYLKNAREVTEEEYKTFYRDTFHDWEEPLFWVHLNVDYPFNLRGILYFPRIHNTYSINDGKVKLYAGQVFVADNVKEVIPEFLLLLKGVIDCPDLPLNVSRSFLQNDGYVKKLSDHITKKVSDRLTALFEGEREQYDKYWDDLHPFIKFGCMRDDKFFDRMKDAVLFVTAQGKKLTLKEAREAAGEGPIYYASDSKRQAPTVELYKQHGIDPILLEHPMDIPFIQFLEYKEEKLKFARVDAELADALKSGGGDEQDKTALEALFRKAMGDDKLEVRLESLSDENIPALSLKEEHMRRFAETSAAWGGGMSDMPVGQSLLLNAAHPVVKALLDKDAEDEEALELCRHIADLAELAREPLSPERMTRFIARCHKMLAL